MKITVEKMDFVIKQHEMCGYCRIYIKCLFICWHLVSKVDEFSVFDMSFGGFLLTAEINFRGLATVCLLHAFAIFLEVRFIQSEEIYIKCETFL